MNLFGFLCGENAIVDVCVWGGGSKPRIPGYQHVNGMSENSAEGQGSK